MDRTVGLRGAVLLGLGSILGTGVFVSLGLAVGVTGTWAVPALCLAACLAGLNALSSAELAANHPVSGGTYAYGYRYLNPDFGFGAGLAFLLAKSASAAAAAIGLAGYVLAGLGLDPALTNVMAAVTAMAVTALVALGLRRANPVNAVLVAVTLGVLILLAVMALVSPATSPYVAPATQFAPAGFLEATALLFVAFTGYGRIATLGEEVRAPRRTIPRAIILTLIVSTLLYLGILLGGLNVLGSARFAAATTSTAAPLQAVAVQLGAHGSATRRRPLRRGGHHPDCRLWRARTGLEFQRLHRASLLCTHQSRGPASQQGRPSLSPHHSCAGLARLPRALCLAAAGRDYWRLGHSGCRPCVQAPDKGLDGLTRQGILR